MKESDMKKKMMRTALAAGTAAFLLGGCGNTPAADSEEESVGLSTHIEGDSTLYGLACDGCTDTVLVFLPGQGGDPVTYHILEATKAQRVIGRPMVGDWVAVIRNGTDTTRADMVIDLDQLKGTWVTQMMPTVRAHAVASSDSALMAHRDSMVRQLMQPIEMGFALKRHYTAQAIGNRRQMSDDNSPVVYPTAKNYSQWHVVNGRLVLTEKKETPLEGTDSAVVTLHNDTADFVFMRKDSLRLRFADGERGYYRRADKN